MTRCALSDKFVASRHGIQNFPGTEGIPWVPWNRGVHVGRITSPLRCNPQKRCHSQTAKRACGPAVAIESLATRSGPKEILKKKKKSAWTVRVRMPVLLVITMWFSPMLRSRFMASKKTETAQQRVPLQFEGQGSNATSMRAWESIWQCCKSKLGSWGLSLTHLESNHFEACGSSRGRGK